ncbi:MAG: ABC transporter permease, partial [Marivita sp. XM-24bin2]
MMGRSEKIGLLALPGLAFLAVVFALPLLLLLLKSFQIDGQFSIEEYRLFFGDEFNRTALARTLRVAALTTLLALLIAY